MLLSFVKLSSLVFLKNYTFDPLPAARKTRSHALSYPAHPTSDRNFSLLLFRSRGIDFFFSAARSGLRLLRSRGSFSDAFPLSRDRFRMLFRSRGSISFFSLRGMAFGFCALADASGGQLIQLDRSRSQTCTMKIFVPEWVI